MTVKRACLSVVLVVLLLLAAFPAAEAQRPCAEALTRCAGGCNQRFGDSGFLSSVLVTGCVEGCNIGYFWCAASN
jgi:hypothetical protein